MRSSSGGAGGSTMTRLGLRVLVFLLPLIAMAAFLEVCLAKFPNSYAIKRERLAALASEIETLILGPSSAFSDVVPSRLDGSVFNLANVNQTLYYDDRLFVQVLPALPRLRRVLIVVEYSSLFRQLERGQFEDWRQYYYAQEWNIPPRLPRERWDVRMWSRLALAWPPFPMTAVLGGLHTLRTGLAPASGPDIDSRGWQKLPGIGDMTDQRAVTTLARHHEQMLDANVPDNVGYLEHMLSLIAERHMEGVLVTLPVWRSYRDGMRPDVRKRATDIYKRLAREHGARYLCFLETPLDAKDFRNPDHLNEEGAVRFTGMLNAALASPEDPDHCGPQ